MSDEPNLAKAQALVVAWRFLLPSYSPRLARRVLLAIVLAAGTLIDIVLLTVYCTTSRYLCHSESCANLVTKLAIILAASYLQSYSPHPTCYRPHRQHPHRHHTRRVLRVLILAASYPLSFSPPAPSLTSYSSRCIVQLPAVCHSESCANHVTKLAIILAASYLQSYSLRPTCYRPRRQHPH